MAVRRDSDQEIDLGQRSGVDTRIATVRDADQTPVRKTEAEAISAPQGPDQERPAPETGPESQEPPAQAAQPLTPAEPDDTDIHGNHDDMTHTHDLARDESDRIDAYTRLASVTGGELNKSIIGNEARIAGSADGNSARERRARRAARQFTDQLLMQQQLEAQLAALDQRIGELDREIGALEQEIAEQEAQVSKSEEAMAEKFGPDWREKLKRGELDKYDPLIQQYLQQAQQLDAQQQVLAGKIRDRDELQAERDQVAAAKDKVDAAVAAGDMEEAQRLYDEVKATPDGELKAFLVGKRIDDFEAKAELIESEEYVAKDQALVADIYLDDDFSGGANNAGFSYDDVEAPEGASTTTAFIYDTPATGTLAKSIEETPIGGEPLKPVFTAASDPAASTPGADQDSTLTAAAKKLDASSFSYG